MTHKQSDKKSKPVSVKRVVLAILATIATIVALVFSPRIVYAYLAIVAFVPTYLVINLLVVAWIRRRAEGWARSAKAFALRQIRPLTAARIRITCLGHAIAFVLVIAGIRTRLEIVELALLLLTYIAVVSALTLSLLADMPVFKRLWADVFSRVLLLGAPLVLGYLMRGYSQIWLDETLTFSADNAPMAHFAGTVMMAGIAASSALLITAFAFEVAMIFMPALPTGGARKRRRKASTPAPEADGTVAPDAPPAAKPTLRSMTDALFSAKLNETTPEARQWRSTKRVIGLFLLFSFSFLGCISGVQVALMPFRSGLGKIVLATIAFDFDAAPADPCSLTKEERDATKADPVMLKAMMLSTSQEKAILVTASPHLFDPILWKSLDKGPARKLTVGRPVACFEAASAAQR